MATIQEAIAEAYASAPQDLIVLHSLEINHRSFEEPIRVVRWPVLDNEPEIFTCRLEDDAPYNPGQRVEFIGAPFELTLPEQAAEASGAFSIQVDNIGDYLDSYLENASSYGGPISAIYRTFLKGYEDDGPSEIWQAIDIKSPRLEGAAVVADGAVFPWMGRAYGRLITAERYPRLITSR